MLATQVVQSMGLVTYLLSLTNSCRLTSKTVFSKPMLAPWYKPTWCSQMLTIKTSLVARANRALFRSKSWSSPLSRPSVPSTSMTRMLSAMVFSPWFSRLFLDIQIPFVVWRRSSSAMTPKDVLNRWLSRVDLPVLWEPKTEIRW